MEIDYSLWLYAGLMLRQAGGPMVPGCRPGGWGVPAGPRGCGASRILYVVHAHT